jgi:AraC-like DNA-binding protein
MSLRAMPTASPVLPPLSQKRAQLAAQGFALRHSRDVHYEYDWHVHDCAMLLWPRKGALRSAWHNQEQPAAHTVQMRLSRSQAIFLPAAIAHRTHSETERQEHGELYLAPELLRAWQGPHALALDAAALCMLDALLAPTLTPQAAEPLVNAVVWQIGQARPLHAQPPRSPAQALQAQFAKALEWSEPLPSIDAVACVLGLSSRQLQRLCSSELGCSPVQLRRHMQAAHARQLLARGHTLAQVSGQLGFATSGHLTRLLRSTGQGAPAS